MPNLHGDKEADAPCVQHPGFHVTCRSADAARPQTQQQSEEIINLSRPFSVANWKLQVKQSGRYVMSDLQVSCCKISWCV